MRPRDRSSDRLTGRASSPASPPRATTWASRTLAPGLLCLSLTSIAHARPPADRAPHLELAWRWGVSPLSTDGPRVLDQVDLAVRVPLAGGFSLVPHFGVGVSYGQRWVMLGSFGLEAAYAWSFDRYRVFAAGGLLAVGEDRGGGRLRDALVDDVGLVARGGFLRRLDRVEVGAELRVAGGLLGRLEVAGPLDVGVAGRLAVPLARRR